MRQSEILQSFHFASDDGIDLHGRIHDGGAADRRPVVCLAGLSRNSRDFDQIARILAATGRRVIALDYRGRGLSAWDPNPANYNLLREAQDVLQAMAHLDIAEADFIGTSRGGLILHFLPSMAPGLVRSLVLNDVGPVIDVEGLRQIRDYLSVRQEPRDLAEAARGLKAIHGDAFSALEDRDWMEMAAAIYRDIGGRLLPDYDPALVEPLKTLDLSVTPPALWDQFTALDPLPLLIIRGENSSLLSMATVEDMVRRHSRAQSFTAQGQGHAPLLHLPDVATALKAFFQDH